MRITPLIRTTVMPISGVIGTTVVRIASVVSAGWAYSHEDRTCVGIVKLHRGWLSLHRWPPVNVPILCSCHPCKWHEGKGFRTTKFSSPQAGIEPRPPAPEASVQITELPRFLITLVTATIHLIYKPLHLLPVAVWGWNQIPYQRQISLLAFCSTLSLHHRFEWSL